MKVGKIIPILISITLLAQSVLPIGVFASGTSKPVSQQVGVNREVGSGQKSNYQVLADKAIKDYEAEKNSENVLAANTASKIVEKNSSNNLVPEIKAQNPILLAEAGPVTNIVALTITKVVNPETKTVARTCTNLEALKEFLPLQVLVELSNGSSVYMDVSWENVGSGFFEVAYPETDQLTGVLVNLPAGVSNPVNIKAGMELVRGDYTTPRGYADSDYQDISHVIDSVVSADGLTLTMEDSSRFIWTTALKGGIVLKHIQTINLSGVKASGSGEGGADLSFYNLSELITIMIKNSVLRSVSIGGSNNKLQSVTCTDSGITSFYLEKGSCPILANLDCSGNNLKMDKIPGIDTVDGNPDSTNSVPSSCTYVYSPQNFKTGTDTFHEADNTYDLVVSNPAAVGVDKGTTGFFFSIDGSGEDFYKNPYTLKWVDGNGNAVPYYEYTSESIGITTKYAFIPAIDNGVDNQGRNIHYELNRADLPLLTIKGPAITLPVYGQQVLGVSIDATIDYANHKILIGNDIEDYTNINISINVPAGSTTNLTAGAINLTSPVTFTVTDSNGGSQLWSIERQDKSPYAEIKGISFKEVTSDKVKSCVIDSSAGEVHIDLDATAEQVQSLTPLINISPGASISPVSNAAVNFLNVVTYTVTSEDGNVTKQWKIYVSYAGSQCTCKITDIQFATSELFEDNFYDPSGSWPYRRLHKIPIYQIENGISIVRNDCTIPGHSQTAPNFTYEIGSVNEVNGEIKNFVDDYGQTTYSLIFTNPGAVSIKVTASLNGSTFTEEKTYTITTGDRNLKLNSSSFQVPLLGDDINLNWSDSKFTADKIYKIYYSTGLGTYDTRIDIGSVTGKNSAPIPWIYGDGYITVMTMAEGNYYTAATAKVTVRPLKVKTDITIPTIWSGEKGGYNNKDLIIDYELSGQDYEAYKDRIRLYAKIGWLSSPGTNTYLTEGTDYTITDKQIIIRKEAFPEINPVNGMPLFFITVGVQRKDGRTTGTDNIEGNLRYIPALNSYYQFCIYLAPEVPTIIDYKGNKLGLTDVNSLKIGPGFTDMSKITIGDLLKVQDNPASYGSELGTVYKNGSQYPLSSAWKYSIDNTSVAQFYYYISVLPDGTTLKIPKGIIGKSDGSCIVTITDTYTGDVIQFKVEVKLAEDQLVWFRLVDTRGVPFNNSRLDILNTNAPLNGKVTYWTKSGVKKTVLADSNGYVLIYEPEGITSKVEGESDYFANTSSEYMLLNRGNKTLDLSTSFKIHDSYDPEDTYWINGKKPFFQYLYLNETCAIDGIRVNPVSNTPVGAKPGLSVHGSNLFNTFAMDRVRTGIYIVDKDGNTVYSAEGITKEHRNYDTSRVSNIKEATMTSAAYRALQEDESKVVVEITPVAPESNFTYTITGNDGFNASLTDDGKSMNVSVTDSAFYDIPMAGPTWGPGSPNYKTIKVKATDENNIEKEVSIYIYICTGSDYYRNYYYNKYKNDYVSVIPGQTYTLDLDSIFKKPVIQPTLYERTVGQLRSEWGALKDPYINVPITFTNKNGSENSISTVTITDAEGKITDASTRTSPVGISGNTDVTVKAYIKSEDVTANDTIEVYKGDARFGESDYSVVTYYLGSGSTGMKYKWYVSTLKINGTNLPASDYFKPTYKIYKSDGTVKTATPKFEAVNTAGLEPNPKVPESLPSTGSLSSGAFNSSVMNGVSGLDFSLPSNFNVQVEYEFGEGNVLEGTFRMLVGYGSDMEKKTGNSFNESYAKAMDKIKYNGMNGTKGSKVSASFEAVGYVEGIVRFVDGKYKLITTGGGLIASAGFDFSYCQNAFVGFIPVYYGIDIGASLTMEAAFMAYDGDDSNAVNDDFDAAYKMMVTVAGYVKISGGLGFDFGAIAAKIGAFGQLDISYTFAMLYSDGDIKTGGQFKLSGTIGIEAVVKFLFYKKRYVFCDAGFIYTHNTGDYSLISSGDSLTSAEYPLMESNSKTMAIYPLSAYNPNGTAIGRYVLLDTGYEVEDRDYLKNPQVWGNIQKSYSLQTAAIALDSVDTRVQGNAYPYSYPFVSSDNQVMAMITDGGSTDINNMTPVYLKNVNGMWTYQGEIDPSEDTASFNMSYDGNGVFGIAAWENIKTKYSDGITDSDMSTIAGKTEIKASVYNGTSWSTTKITDDTDKEEVPDLGPKVDVNGDKGAVLWMRTLEGYGDTDPMTSQNKSALVLKTYSNGAWSEEKVLNIPSQQTIKSYDIAMMSDGTIMVVYGYEKPGATGGDMSGREIARILIKPNGTAADAINITSDKFSDTNPKVTARKLMINGTEKEYFYVAWYNETLKLTSGSSTSSAGQETIKDILLRSYDANNEDITMQKSIYVTREDDDPSVSENFSFIKSDDSSPESFGISWLTPYTSGDSNENYGIISKLGVVNGGVVTMSAPLSIYKVGDKNDIIDFFSQNISIKNGVPYINTALTKTHYTAQDGNVYDPSKSGPPHQTDIYSSQTYVKDIIGIEATDFEKDMVIPDMDTRIRFTVANRGIKNIKNLEITSSEEQSFTPDIQIAPGKTADAIISYHNGGIIVSRNFTVIPVYTDGSKGEAATAEVSLGMCDLEIVDITNTNAGENGLYTFEISIRNSSRYKMTPNNLVLDLGIYDDIKRTIRADVQPESRFVNINSTTGEKTLLLDKISDVNLDEGIAKYSFTYKVATDSYDGNGMKILYVTLKARDSAGNAVKELSSDTNDGIVGFTDPKVLHKEPVSVELTTTKSNTGTGGNVTANITNLMDSAINYRMILTATDADKNFLESHAVEIMLDANAQTEVPFNIGFIKIGSNINYKIIAPDVLGFTAETQDGTNAKITVTAFGGSGSYEYSMDNGTSWQSSNIFANLATGTYVVCVRDAGNISNISGSITVSVTSMKYIVDVAALTGGSIVADPTTAAAGDTITLSVAPDIGKRLKAGSLKYNDGTDHAITGTTFIMPAAHVTVSAEFEDIPASVSNADKVAEDKAALIIGYAAGDNVTSVTKNLNLTVTGAVYGSTITWASSNTAVISNIGIVTRPSFASGDAAVTVTATVYNAGASDTKDFNLVVLKLPLEQTKYVVTVENGNGSGSYAENAAVSITADTAPQGKVFDKWISGDGVTFADASASSTTFIMPAKAVTVTAMYKDAPVSTYTISIGTLIGGSIVANPTTAAAGDTIILTVTPDIAKRFKPGSLKYNDGTDHAITGATFIMPAANVTVSAGFEDIPASVSNADKVAADKAALSIGYAAGDIDTSVTKNLYLTVTGVVYGSSITWVSSNTAVISNSGIVTRPDYTSGDAAVTVTATVYNSGASDTKSFNVVILKLPLEQTKYVVTVENGTGSGSYAENAMVSITADTAAQGKVFDKWISGDGVTFADASASSTTFIMPAKAVTVTAIYKDAPAATYTISIGTLIGGSIAANPTTAKAGDTITLMVTPDSGKRLKAGSLKYNDGTDHAITGTTFIMPAANVTASAEFEDIPASVSNADKVAADKAALNIGYAAGDNAASVTKNLNLMIIGEVYGSTITWVSDNTNVISNSGIVTRPAYASGDTAVTVTATVYNAGASDMRAFNLVVLKLPQTNYTVTFDKNGGDTEANPATMTVVSGDNVGTLPTAPTRSGYTFSGWNTVVNGSGTTFTAATTVNTNLTVYAQWTVITSGGGSYGGGGSTSGNTATTTNPTTTVTTNTETSSPSVTSTTTAEAKSDSNGKAAAVVTESQINEAVSKAVEAAAKQGEGTAAKVVIKVTAPAEAKTVEASLPKVAVAAVADNKTDDLTVSTPVASITFDKAAINTISKEAAGDVKITASKVDAIGLSEAAKAAIGDRPVFNFSVTSVDKNITRFGGTVTVTVPYTPKAGEDINAIVIYYINAEGKPEPVSNCTYDPATGTIRFNTNHFSNYAIGYNKVIFKDVDSDVWYGKAVGFVSARDITTGTGNGNYSPEAELTRAELLVMVMRAYGISPDANPADNFADAGNAYYTGYLAAAKRLGITAGTGNNMFAPEKEITRQEMFTLLYNILKQLGELPTIAEGKTLASYSDSNEIEPWAKEAMALFVGTGTISGSGSNLNPTDTTNRAQIAQVLYNLLSK